MQNSIISKAFLTIIIVGSLQLNTFGQLGVGIGFAKGIYELNFQYILSKKSFNMSFLGDMKDKSLGPSKTYQLSNYGRTSTGTGKYFSGVRFSFDYLLIKNFSLGGDLIAGSNNSYINYIDRRFKNGGYHLIIKREGQIGIGSYLSYGINEHVKVSIGYNSFLKNRLQANYVF